MRFAVFMAVLGVLEALHCDKEFNYYDNYGNGFDITCQGITKGYVHLLQNITIINEITLKIENSSLTNVSSKIFQNVDNIRYLYVDNSVFTFPRVSSVFEALVKLEHLVIRNTTIFVNRMTLAGLSSLKELILDNNNLEEMEEGSLKSLTNLRRLQMTNNKITDLRSIPLCELRKLKDLDLSKNFISSLKNAHFYCRQSTKSVGLNLNQQNYLLDLNKKDYFSVTDITFNLQTIDLSYNNISNLDYVLSDLKKLKILNLEGNRLVHIDDKQFKSLENLEKVYVSHNLLESIEEKVFDNQKHLAYIDLSYNKLTYFSLNNTPMLEYINLAHNMLDVFSLHNVNNTSHLKTFILCNNRIGDIHPFAFQKHESLEVLDIACNSIKLHSHSFGGLFHLEELSLSNNSISEVPPHIFRNLTNLKTLDLSLNRIEAFTHDTFVDLNSLSVLNISYNLLRELSYAIVEPLKNLNVLDIAGNQLHYIQYDLIISNLPFISVLNVKSNMLSCEMLYKIIKYLKRRRISYTINEDFDYEQENVAGIYCNSEKNVVSDSLRSESMSGGSYALLVLGAVLGLILVLIVVVVSLFKIHLFLKRRLYKADEFELIDE